MPSSIRSSDRFQAGRISNSNPVLDALLLGCGDQHLNLTRHRGSRTDYLKIEIYLINREGAKRLEQQERHLRYNETPFSLEPNFKEAPGGLRDLQIIFWIAKAAGYGSTWDELGENGIMSQAGICVSMMSTASSAHS
mgnify:CR=1 FL=1